MKRENTACEEMIEECRVLKKQGVIGFICTTIVTLEDGTDKYYKPVMKQTAQGISAYANRMYNKYGDNTTVEVGYFDREVNWHMITTYHA